MLPSQGASATIDDETVIWPKGVRACSFDCRAPPLSEDDLATRARARSRATRMLRLEASEKRLAKVARGKGSREGRLEPSRRVRAPGWTGCGCRIRRPAYETSSRPRVCARVSAESNGVRRERANNSHGLRGLDAIALNGPSEGPERKQARRA
ncbi:hypothetical protein L1887_58045 [Cichorium endivia]|nr:hypothetical protein L1887_58045 [Cichorium endivia]